MTPERWQQIEKIYHSTLELAENQRIAFLEKACAGDEALRQEVESLLRSEPSEDGFIEEPALAVAAKMMAHERPESLLGQQLGSYQILSLLGTGGMGVVYKARDPRLKRTVAIQRGVGVPRIQERLSSSILRLSPRRRPKGFPAIL